MSNLWEMFKDVKVGTSPSAVQTENAEPATVQWVRQGSVVTISATLDLQEADNA